MPAINTFKHALAAKKPQIGIWSTLCDPFVSELIAGAGFDWVMLDTEHAPSDPVHILRQLQAVQAERERPNFLRHREPAVNDEQFLFAQQAITAAKISIFETELNTELVGEAL